MAYSARGESSSSSGTCYSTPLWKYDVFLSFAGKDTRLKFTGHLDAAFTTSGLKTFRDDVDLEKGEDIKPGLFQAIQDSLCAVLIISKNYAESSWCLEELEKILESRQTLGQRVIPIFYDVNPGDVKHLRGSFGEALAKHEKEFIEDKEKVENWRNVLSQIGSISGEDTRGRHEADLIKNIVRDVWTYLSSKLPSYEDNLVGIDSRVADLMPFLEIGLDDTRFVGIWGMGGVGKTTLARVVFEKISDNFEICCFLANVRETLQREGLLSLQKRLLSHLKIKDMGISDDHEGMKMIRKFLSNKKVLLVLDDLDDISQLRNLAESPEWFGKGSRLMITTRDNQLLASSGVYKQRIYEMETMKKEESLQLFSIKAFSKDHPEENYLELSKSVVEYAGSLPLALEVLGCFLCGRSKAEWRDALNRLKHIPNNSILQVLQISYDGLNKEEKKIFLDIACCFNHQQKKEVTRILHSCDFHSTIGIKVLIEKALLVETEDCRLHMHDLLEDLGRYIVCQESPNIGKRSRLWKFEDIKEVLENNKGSEKIEVIVVEDYCWNPDKIEVHPKAFSKMSNIRLLLTSYSSLLIFPPVGLKVSSALKVVRWESFPFEAFPFSLEKLVHIEMRYSKIKQLWNGIQFMTKLKFIDLSYSENFTETPDFSGVPYLEYLYLRGCTSLIKVHPSLGKLKELVELVLISCKNLEILPRKLETNSLIKLDLSGCKRVAVLPEFGKGMNKLAYLDASRTSITRIPESLGSMTSLSYLDLAHPKALDLNELSKTQITLQINLLLNATSLTELHLSGCGLNDGSIPNDFGSLSSLIVLDLSHNNFVNLPTGCFSSLFRLVFLSLNCCKRLKSMPRLPPRLIRLDTARCNSMEPLSERRLWNLVASLDHEYRGRTKYVMSEEEHDDSPLEHKRGHVDVERLPLSDFCAIIPGHRIPSWFPNIKYLVKDRWEYEIKVNIPQKCRDSEWSGIVVCLLFSCDLGSIINWSSKAAEDDDYIFKDWAHTITFGWAEEMHHMCIMVLELNEETCWHHLRTSHHNSLHINLSTHYKGVTPVILDDKIEILGSGWRVICKEEIQEWCNRNDFNQIALPLHASPHELKLPWRALERFIGKKDVEEFLTQEMDDDGCCVM